MGSLTGGLQISLGSGSMLFFGNLHTLSLQGIQNISGFVTKSILSHTSFSSNVESTL